MKHIALYLALVITAIVIIGIIQVSTFDPTEGCPGHSSSDKFTEYDCSNGKIFWIAKN